MIRVKKVVGESFDLETGQGTPKGLVLANNNGHTVVVEVSDEDVEAILALMADERNAGPKPASLGAEVREDAPGPRPGGTDTLKVTQDELNGYYRGNPDDFDLPGTRSSPEDDYDPGETYGDMSSGLPSI
jgi:hypothetical protein